MKKRLYVLCVFLFFCTVSVIGMESSGSIVLKKGKIEEQHTQHTRVPLSLKAQAGIKINKTYVSTTSSLESLTAGSPAELSEALPSLPHKVDVRQGLRKAIKHNNYEFAQQWISYAGTGTDVNTLSIGNCSDTPLHLAALDGNERLLQLFLQKTNK